jgi:hypothetical protein
VLFRSLVSSVFPFGQFSEAMRFAADKSQALKVQVEI